MHTVLCAESKYVLGDDLSWLWDVHIRGKMPYSEFVKTKVAVLQGNEDCPQKISLYKRDNHKCRPFIVFNE